MAMISSPDNVPDFLISVHQWRWMDPTVQLPDGEPLRSGKIL